MASQLAYVAKWASSHKQGSPSLNLVGVSRDCKKMGLGDYYGAGCKDNFKDPFVHFPPEPLATHGVVASMLSVAPVPTDDHGPKPNQAQVAYPQPWAKALMKGWVNPPPSNGCHKEATIGILRPYELHSKELLL